MRRNGVVKKCPICEREFYVSLSKKHVECCSIDCANKKRKKIMNKECAYCGNLFSPYNSHQKYCSNQCSWASKKKGEYKICENCGKDFWVMPCEKDRRKYCCRKCEDEYKKRDNYFTCKRCGKNFYSSHQREFCSKSCSNLYIAQLKREATLAKIDAYIQDGGNTIGGLQEKGVSSTYGSKLLRQHPERRVSFDIGGSYWEDKFKKILQSVIQ